MKTWVLCISRRKLFEWITRSRSRWKAVRTGEGSSSWRRWACSLNAAAGDSVCRSICSMRARVVNGIAGLEIAGWVICVLRKTVRLVERLYNVSGHSQGCIGGDRKSWDRAAYSIEVQVGQGCHQQFVAVANELDAEFLVVSSGLHFGDGALAKLGWNTRCPTVKSEMTTGGGGWIGVGGGLRAPGAHPVAIPGAVTERRLCAPARAGKCAHAGFRERGQKARRAADW